MIFTSAISAVLFAQALQPTLLIWGGKKHQKKLSGGAVFCSVCQVFVTRQRWREHLENPAHLGAANFNGTDPNIAPEEQATPRGTRHCDLCDCNIPEDVWGRHINGKRHHNKEKFYAFKSVFQEAEKDKHGVTVSHLDGVDFGIIELLDGLQGVRMTVVLQTTVPQSRIRVLELKLSSTSLRGRQVSPYVTLDSSLLHG